MKLSSQRGVALVITLIFLSIITFLAVAFLATARRDKSSMSATQNQTGSKLMADVGLARAQAEILGKMMVRSNLLGIDMMVSRNFINVGGFNTAQPAGQVDTNNVNYDYTQAGVALTQNQFIQNVANLWYDPRPPVFVKTNKFGPLDPRFYLDLNRNGRFDTNGYRRALDRNGNAIPNGAGGFVTNFLKGDPEWIGVLARPEQPHSSSNQFVGRFAYVVVPIGLTLDINYLHNQTKQLGPGVDGFLRNQGVGSWELNLAAFLRDLNTNTWSYSYDTNLGAQSIFGVPYDAFADAKDILTNRYGGTYNNLSSFANLFTAPAVAAFQTDGIDGYGAGPLMDTMLASGHVENLAETARKWSGSDSPRKVMNIDDLLVLGKTPSTFIAHLGQTLTNRSSYDASTYYRLIEQLGTESGLELRGKMNLNYTNNPALNSADTNFVAWTPSGFFTNAADLMLRSYTNNLSITNIQIFPTNQYTPAVHRLLQLAANIYDSTSRRSVSGSTNDFPSVFRPIFRKDNNNSVFITGYLEETNTAFLSYRFFDMVTVASNSVPNLDVVNIYGVPCVIGAKKGLPNFNEYSLQTAVRVTRKLQFLKLANAVSPYRTNQMYIFSITNFLGVEAWNSYTQAFPRAVQIIATNFSTVRLTNENGVIPNSVNPLLLRSGNRLTLGPNLWNGFTGTGLSGNFQIPILTYVPILPTSRYRPDRPASQIFDTNLVFDATATGFPVPNVGMLVSNRLVFAIVDTSVSPNRVLDMVSLADMNVGFNINEELNRPTPIFGSGVSSALNRMWRTNRLNGSTSINTATEGIAAQVDVGLNIQSVTASEWRSFNAQVGDKDVSVRAFNSQMYTNTPYATNFYAPFEPTVVFVKSFSLQANDPLVHYTSKDLTDPKTANVTDFINPPNPPTSVNIFTNISLYNVGKLNTRYSPWINPLKGIDPDIGLDPAFKDPLIYNSDNWDFSTNKFPTIGWLGRVHRGTPWQTVYFKSAIADPQKWVNAWGSTMDNHPTNDWRLVDLFTVAPNDNAARGLLSVNQTGQAAWAAGLGGILVLSNSVDNAVISPRRDQYVALPIEPASAPLTTIVDGVNRYRAKIPGRTFRSVGEVLGVPELTISSPLLNTNGNQTRYGISDAAYERIPLQLMSLLKLGDPRFVVYSYGQSLKPLNVHLGAQYFNMVTNYQITGEVATKTVLRVQGGPNGQYDARNPRVIIESFTLLPAE